MPQLKIVFKRIFRFVPQTVFIISDKPNRVNAAAPDRVWKIVRVPYILDSSIKKVLNSPIVFPAVRRISKPFLKPPLKRSGSVTNALGLSRLAATEKWSAAVGKTGSVSMIPTLSFLRTTSPNSLPLTTAVPTTFRCGLLPGSFRTTSLSNLFVKPTKTCGEISPKPSRRCEKYGIM